MSLSFESGGRGRGGGRLGLLQVLVVQEATRWIVGTSGKPPRVERLVALVRVDQVEWARQDRSAARPDQ